FKEEGIEHQTSTPRTPGQNGVVERRNHTLVEATRMMLSASKLPLQNVVPTAEKIDSSQQGLEFIFSPLLKEYYNPAYGHAEDNNNDQALNALIA
ncbi:putative ribonuclease H-like domain-containing protein, partial [Tanacetum coccineum]